MDGGFLPSLVAQTELIMLPGERGENIVDSSDGLPAMISCDPKDVSNWRSHDRGVVGEIDWDDLAGGMNDMVEILAF